MTYKMTDERRKVLAGLKNFCRVVNASCESCIHRGSDDDGNYPELMVSWPICEKHTHYANLKSFPFKKDMPCWEPDYWKCPGDDMPAGLTDDQAERWITEDIEKFYKCINEISAPLLGGLD